MNSASSLVAAMLCLTATPAMSEAELVFSARVAAAPEQVWQAWTTEAGAQRFFAPKTLIEPRVDGRYEILFNPSAAPGRRGAEGARILALEAPARVMFTWDAPPQYPSARGQRSVVEVQLSATDGGTRVRLRHFAFGHGQEWDATRRYFSEAWIVVLGRLVRSFASAPMAWDAELSRPYEQRLSEARPLVQIHHSLAGLRAASEPEASSDAAGLLAKMFSLQGEWTGHFSWSGGRTHSGEIKAVYRTTGAGSALVEDLIVGGAPSMTSVYHLDGGELRMTHFCAARNQPRLKAQRISETAGEAEFGFVDITNLGDRKSGYVQAFSIRMIDNNNLHLRFTFKGESADSFEDIHLKRASPRAG